MARSKLWWPAAEPDRLGESIELIDPDVGPERTPRRATEAGTRHRLVGLPPPNTGTLREGPGVERGRVAVDARGRKTDLQSADGRRPARVAADQNTIRVTDTQYWPCVAVDPEPNSGPRSRLPPTGRVSSARESPAVCLVDDVPAVCLVDDVEDLIGGPRREGYSGRVQRHGSIAAPSNGLCER